MSWSQQNAIVRTSYGTTRPLNQDEILQGVVNEAQNALKVEGAGDAAVLEQLTALNTSIGTGADGAGDPTVIGLLKQIAINTTPAP